MASGYTYELRLKDLMSRGFIKAAQASSKFYNKLIGNQKKYLANSKRVPANIAQLEKQLSRLANKRDNAFDVKAIKRYNTQIRKTERQLQKLKNLPPKSLSERFKGLKSIVGGLAIGAMAFGAAKGVVSLGVELEQTRVSFQTMLGSAEKGNQLLKKINDFANVTPFANSDLQDSAKVLLNFGIAGDKVIPTLKNIGDISGGNKEKLNGLTLAFAQVSSAGKLQGQDLMQMINAGFNPLLEISRTTGESMASLKERMSKGAISAQMVESAFASATAKGGMFHGMMEKQSKTLGGKWSTLVGKFQSKVASLGEKLAPYLGMIVDFVTNNLDVLIPLAGAISAVVAVQWLWNIAMSNNQIGLIIIGISALIALIALVIKNWESWGKYLTIFMGPLGVVIHMVQTFRKHWQKISEAFSGEGMLAGIKAIGVMLVDFMLEPLQSILELAGKIPGLGYLAEAGAEKIKNLRRSMGIEVDSPNSPANMSKLEKFNMVIAHLNSLPLTMAQKLQAFTSKISKLDMPEALRKKAVEEAKKRFAMFEKNKQKGIEDNTVEGTDGFSTNSSNITQAQETSNSIVTGGKKQFVLNIQINKVLETVNQTITNGKDSADELVDEILDNLTRRLHGTFRSIGQ